MCNHTLYDVIKDMIIPASGVVGQVGVAIVVYLAARKISKVEYTRGLQESWNELNTMVLTDSELLKPCNSVFNPYISCPVCNPVNPKLSTDKDTEAENSKEKEELIKIHMRLKILNIIQSAYIGYTQCLISEDYYRGIENILITMLQDEELIPFMRKSGYQDEFVAYCETLKNNGKKIYISKWHCLRQYFK